MIHSDSHLSSSSRYTQNNYNSVAGRNAALTIVEVSYVDVDTRVGAECFN